MSNEQIDVYLVCNARFHDTNFARLELLKLLAEDEDINTRVADSFENTIISGSPLAKPSASMASMGHFR